jgi:HSP20 family molecular chaperone IbpA
MQNNPNNPYDDVFKNLAKIVEDIVKNMPDNEHARIVGYTIISRHPMDGDPGMFRGGIPEDDSEIPYEMTESEGEIFITAELPTTIKNAPVVDIEPERVQITADDRTTTILLEHKVDRIHSYYRVHRSVMDITLKKEPLLID